MNKKEIDEMMNRLPSQQPEESLRDKILIGLVFVTALVILVMMPDLVPFNPLCK